MLPHRKFKKKVHRVPIYLILPWIVRHTVEVQDDKFIAGINVMVTPVIFMPAEPALVINIHSNGYISNRPRSRQR